MTITCERARIIIRGLVTIGLLAVLAAAGGCVAARPMLVRDGQPQAEIIVDAEPPRMVNWAVEDLQEYVEKITGARLPVVTEPSGTLPLRIYVGRSAHTDALGITDAGLDYGAFRMVAGTNWLALVGQDADFVPQAPFSLEPSPNHPDRLRMMAEWDALTGSHWNCPPGALARLHNRRLQVFAGDRRGSLNAVHEFLRRLGVRWYMPGELGEVVPRMRNLALPKVDETVRPVYRQRNMDFATYFSSSREDINWYLRQGFNHSYETGRHLSHGLRDVLAREEMKTAHPGYYAMRGGRRDTDSRHACLSAPGLVKEAARFARAMFDVYDQPTVSMMPEDGFRFCECELCAGQDTPERGRKGAHSDYVWGFVDKVAREVYTTHPDRTINCYSYGSYTLPPETIEKFSPNVQVGIVHGRGWYFPDPPVQYARAELELSVMDVRRGWQEKTDNLFRGWEHYPFTHRGTFLPIYFTRAIDAGIKAQYGTMLGEFVETAIGPFDERGHGLHAPAFNHLNIYVTGRLYWNPQLNLDVLLDEYFRLFYGPAADDMRKFVAYCEEHWQAMRADGAHIARALEYFDAARGRVAADSVYARRLELLADYLLTLRQMGEQLRRGRDDVPEARGASLRRLNEQIDFNGCVDETAWGRVAQYRGYALHDPQTGARPEIKTSFAARWDGEALAGSLYFGIICEEPDMGGMPAVDGPDIMRGDTVELLLETQAHSYYHLAIGPHGGLLDFDCQGGQRNPRWSSAAEVKTRHGDGWWSAEVRVPVTGLNRLPDPLHELAGRLPREDFPWFINVIRQRVRGDVVERWVWSPGGDDLHDVMKFGKFWVR